MQPMPRLIEKKDCPRASSTVVPVILLKSGFSRKSIPWRAPSSVSALRAMPNNSRNSIGIRILLYRSIPFSIPE